MVAVPVMKLFSMTVKTLAKPMSKTIKTEAQKHPTFRGVLNRMGQATNNISARISIRMAGHTTTKIKPLEEDKAIADGGDLLAEGFIYGLGTFLMVFEYVSSANDKERKEEKAKIKKEEEKREMARTLQNINDRLANLEALDQRRNETFRPGGNDQSASPRGNVRTTPPEAERKTLGLPIKLPWGRRKDNEPTGRGHESPRVEGSTADGNTVSAGGGSSSASTANRTGSASAEDGTCSSSADRKGSAQSRPSDGAGNEGSSAKSNSSAAQKDSDDCRDEDGNRSRERPSTHEDGDQGESRSDLCPSELPPTSWGHAAIS